MMSFDELISNGQLTKAARLFAKEYYDSGRMGHTRRLLIERLADKCDKYDTEIARQTVTSEDVAGAIETLKLNLVLEKTLNENGDIENQTYLDAIDLAVTALQAYQPWIPVSERLPESGKHVLLCCEVSPSGKRYVCDGYYAKAKSTTSGYSNDWDCEYDEETDEYYLPEGYYEIIKNWGEYSSIVIEDFVTHWKPLPEPPKGE